MDAQKNKKQNITLYSHKNKFKILDTNLVQV